MSKPHGAHDPKLTVPKFASFKAKKPSAPSAGLGSSDDEKAERHRSKRRRESEHRHDTQEKGHHERHRSRHGKEGVPLIQDRHGRGREQPMNRPSSPSNRNNAPRTITKLAAKDLEPQPSAPARASPGGVAGLPGVFAFDLQGDPLMKKYGSGNRYQLPYRYRSRPGKVLGTSGRLYVHYDGFKEQFSVLRPGERAEFSWNKDGLRSRRPRVLPRSIRLIARGPEDESDLNSSYLSIVEGRKPGRSGSSSESSDSDEGLAYRSIESMKRSEKGALADDDEVEELLDIHADQPLRWRSVQLNRRVRDHPGDIQAWFELVDHQDTLLAAGRDVDDQMVDNEVLSFTDIKISLLEKALLHASEADDIRRLWARLMREGIKVWNQKTAAKRWAEVPESERDSFDLWIIRLDWRMSQITTFQFEDFKMDVVNRLQTLRGRMQNDDALDVTQELIYVFLRATRLFADAGYRELAVASWQALLEMNFFRPTAEQGTASFQDFWESEVPRVGEDGARGWEHFTESGGDAPDPVPEQDYAAQPGSRDAYKLWASSELWRQSMARTAARTMDEGNDDDPFRVVMFSDIEPFVFSVPSPLLCKVETQLIDAFLIFAGLPSAFGANSWTQTALRDQYLGGSNQIIPELEHANAADDETEEDGRRKAPRFEPPMLRCRMSSDVLFPGDRWFRIIPRKTTCDAVDRLLVQNILKTLSSRIDHVELAELYLALVNTHTPDRLKKESKAQLQRSPTNVTLYNAFALAEQAKGNTDNARKVVDAAAALAQGSPLLQLTRTWISLDNGDNVEALRSLCNWASGVNHSDLTSAAALAPTQILKTKQAARSGYADALLSEDLQKALLYGQCLMLLAYLTATESTEPMASQQGSITAAMDVVKDVSSDLGRRRMGDWMKESLLQSAARLHYWHATHGPFRRQYLHQQMSGFLREFPENGIFMALLEWSDSRLRVIDEVRDIFYETCLGPSQDCVSSRVAAIQHEMDRGNVNSTRAAFENAVASSVCKASIPIWSWYIRFANGEKQFRSRAKDLFYRALRECPWSKDIMMLAFTTLVKLMESEELKSVFEMMTAKGLRVHVDMDEFMEEQRHRRGAQGSG